MEQRTYGLGSVKNQAETQKTIVDSSDPSFTKEAGGALFKAKFSTIKFRYDYQGEWIEFEPQNSNATLTAQASNELAYENYWLDTDILFRIRNYGVKVCIVRKTNKAPTKFSFNITRSKNWNDAWIKPAFGYSDSAPDIAAIEELWDWETGKLTYTLSKEFDSLPFPQIIDPTFDLGNIVDDTTVKQLSGVDANDYNNANLDFGKYAYAGNTTKDAFMRWAIGIPRASKILTAVFKFLCVYGQDGAFNTNIYGLVKDNKWETSNGFNASSYALGSNALAITKMSISVAWNNVEAWTTLDEFYSPDISTILQAQVNILSGDNEYDPTDTQNKYVAYTIDRGDGTFITFASGNADVRRAYSYDGNATYSAKLVTTFESWGEIRTPNGMKYDPDEGVYRYYDY